MSDGIYLLVATVADPATCDPIRDTLRGRLVKRQPRWHWRTESAKRRLEMAEVIAGFSLAHTVVIGAPVNERRQERARRICMERLYFELHSREVDTVWVESRHESLNRRDREMVDALRGKGVIGESMRVEFALPKQEPMLWIPDAVAGAVGAFRKGEDQRARTVLGDAVEEISIRLT